MQRMHLAAFVLLALALAVVFWLGRRMEGGADARWQQAAQRVQGRFIAAPPASWIARFGPAAPWHAWARDGALQVPRAVEGGEAQAAFALLQVRYSVREARGETESEQWYEVAVAALRVPQGLSLPLDQSAGADLRATVADGTLFVWKPGPRGAGASLPPEELPALLQQARAIATRLSPATPQGPSAAPASRAPASRRTPP